MSRFNSLNDKDSFNGESPLSNSTPYVVILILAWLLMGPRLPLVNLAGSSMRVEDGLLLVLGIFVLTRWGKDSSRLPRRGVAGIVVVSLVAVCVAVATERVSLGPSLLYSLRILEYWVVFPATYLVLCAGSEKHKEFFVHVLGLVTVVQVAAATAQVMFGLNIGFSKFSMERGAGFTAGPYELGLICSTLAVFWFMRKNHVLAVIAALGVLLSASRISMIGLVVGLTIALVLSKRTVTAAVQTQMQRVANIGVVMALVVVSGVLFAVSPSVTSALGDPVFGRLQSTSTIDSWTISGQFASGITSPSNAGEYHSLAYGSMPYLLGAGGFASTGSGEASDMVRFFRWHILIDSIDSPWEYLLGLGPSYAGASVDGSYVRMVAETGLVGLVVWIWSMRRWSKALDPVYLGALATLFVGAIFIDVLYALRPMVLVWAILAYGDAERAHRQGALV